MGILLGANIGTNYKGILNLNTLNGNLSGTLQAVTDGDGNASLLQLSTTEVAIPTGIFTVDAQMRFNGTIYNTIDDIVKFGGAIRTATFASIGGTFTNSARLHVRGDGTNPIARFDNNAGTSIFTIGSSGSITATGDYIISAAYSAFIHGSAYYGSTNGGAGGLGNSNDINGSVSNQDAYATYIRNQSTFSRTSGTQGILTIGTNTFAAGAGSANFRPLSIAYTINNSGAQTGTATGIFLNATETALNGMTHDLLDLQVGGVSQFKVEREGSTTMASFSAGSGQITGAGSLLVGAKARLYGGSVAGNSLLITDANVTGAAFIQLGGTTNAFPAIKRNSAGIDFRLADDSGYCNISAAAGDFNGYSTGVQRLRFNNGTIGGSIGYLRGDSNGVITLTNAAEDNFSRLQFGASTKPTICQGVGTPEGAVTAPVGSIFMRSDGGAGTSFYVKESGTGNTGWVAK
jgi:hypothetical protein